MSEVSSVNSVSPLPTLQEIAADNNGADINKQEFLELLVAQMKYQDPLEPLSNQEYSAQLAQFSQLEQLQNMNDSLNESLEINLILTQSINNTLSSTIIGKDIKAFGNAVSLTEGEDAEIVINLGGYAKSVEISISDEDGNVVRTIDQYGLSAGEQTIVWDGLNEDGEPADPGYYTYSVEALAEDNSDINVTSYIYGYVSAVRYDNGAAIFQVNGEDVPFSNVLEIGVGSEG